MMIRFREMRDRTTYNTLLNVNGTPRARYTESEYTCAAPSAPAPSSEVRGCSARAREEDDDCA